MLGEKMLGDWQRQAGGYWSARGLEFVLGDAVVPGRDGTRMCLMDGGSGCVGSWFQHAGGVVCWQAVVRTQGFRELSDVVLARVLRSDRLAVDELELVQAVREWAHVSSVSVMQQGPPRGARAPTSPGWECRHLVPEPRAL